MDGELMERSHSAISSLLFDYLTNPLSNGATCLPDRESSANKPTLTDYR
ncbi:MAG: hypothetical protein ACFB16_04440 [Phormidesmis sp.]